MINTAQFPPFFPFIKPYLQGNRSAIARSRRYRPAPEGVIKRTQVLGSRSFMPRGLTDQYTDEQVADLLAYIRTLK